MPRPPVPLLLGTGLLLAAILLTLAARARATGESSSSPGPAGAGHGHVAWRWPVRGRVVRRFRLGRDPFARGQHRGLTVAAAPGVPVLAPCAGRVRFAGTVGASGRTVTIGCAALNATLTHLGVVLARRGRVGEGTVVGRVGRAGRVQLGARIRARRLGYLDPLTLLVADPPAPLGPVPLPGRPREVPPPAPPRPVAAPAPDAPPLGTWWLPAGLGLLGGCALFALGRLAARARSHARARRTARGRAGRASPVPRSTFQATVHDAP